MLPEMSTASSRSRPVTGSVTISPTHCGRAAAATSSSQARLATAASKGFFIQPAEVALISPNHGTRSARMPASGAGRSQRRNSSGSGNSTSAHGQASTSP